MGERGASHPNNRCRWLPRGPGPGFNPLARERSPGPNGSEVRGPSPAATLDPLSSWRAAGHRPLERGGLRALSARCALPVAGRYPAVPVTMARPSRPWASPGPSSSPLRRGAVPPHGQSARVHHLQTGAGYLGQRCDNKTFQKSVAITYIIATL